MGGYNPLANLGLLQNLNPMGQALGSAAPIGALPGNPTMPSMAQPSGQAQMAVQPQAIPNPGIAALNIGQLPGVQQQMGQMSNPGPAFNPNQLAASQLPPPTTQIGPQGISQTPLAGLNPMQQAMRGQQSNVQQPGFWSQFRNNLGQMGGAMGGGLTQQPSQQAGTQGTLGKAGSLLSGSALNTGGAMQKPQYPPAPQFSQMQMPQSQAIPAGTGGTGDWATMMQRINQWRNNGGVLPPLGG